VPTHRHQNPSAYLDARGVAHVQMPEQQEGIPGPRIANMVRSLGLSRAAAERLREKMRRADETGDGIEDILREAQRALRAKSVAYYPGAADAPGAPDGIAFVDRGDPKAETLLYDHRDGRFTVNAWGPAVARQRERFSKNNPDPAKRQNPPRTIVCLTGFGDWWSVSEDQWPKVVRAGMAGDNEAAVKQATRVRQKPWAAVGSAVPVLRSVFDLTPEDWEYYDKEVRDVAASTERARKAARRKNPDPAKRYRDLQRMAAPGSGASENERAMAQRLLAKMTPPPEERPTPRAGGYAYSPPRRQPEPWQTDPRDSTEIYRNDLSDLNFAKKSIYEHASEPRVRVLVQGFDGNYLRSAFSAFSSMNDLGYAAEVLEAWGEDYFKKGGTFEIVIGRVEGEDDTTRILRVRGVDVSHLGLVVHTDDFYDPDLYSTYFTQLTKYLSKNLPKYVAAATGVSMPTQFVTNPRRPRRNPAFKSPHAGPSVKRMVDFLGISKSDAQALKDQMNEGATVGSILKAADRILDGNGVESIGGYGGGLSYVNMGDTYDYTLIYDRKSRRFVAAAWGDIVEAQPRRFAD
jgi:hypothetical protein